MFLCCHAYAIAQYDEEWLEMLQSRYPVDTAEFQYVRWKLFILSALMPFSRGRKKNICTERKEIIRSYSEFSIMMDKKL